MLKGNLVLMIHAAQVEGMLKDINEKETSQGSPDENNPSEGSFADTGNSSGGYVPDMAPEIAADPFLDADARGRDVNEQNQLIGLGMSEALPPFEMIEDL